MIILSCTQPHTNTFQFSFIFPSSPLALALAYVLHCFAVKKLWKKTHRHNRLSVVHCTGEKTYGCSVQNSSATVFAWALSQLSGSRRIYMLKLKIYLFCIKITLFVIIKGISLTSATTTTTISSVDNNKTLKMVMARVVEVEMGDLRIGVFQSATASASKLNRL